FRLLIGSSWTRAGHIVRPSLIREVKAGVSLTLARLVGHRQWCLDRCSATWRDEDVTADTPAREVASSMGAVLMPSVQHLLNGNLDALQEAIHSVSAEDEPT